MTPPIASSFASNGFNGVPSGGAPVVTATSTSHDEPVRLGDKSDIIGNGFIHLSSLTHDTCVAKQHTRIKQLGEDLQSAAKAAWPKQEGSRYSQVCVLLLSWVADDLGVSSEIQRLRHVFEVMYQFQVETYEIPDEKPDRALKGRILEFLINDQDDNLLIFYYAGHARREPQSNEGALWFPNRQSRLTTVPSSGIQTLLEESDSDVLLLYDCCHSAAIASTGCYQGKKGVKEVIAACGYETTAPEVDEHSFTNALIETLALASKGTSFSVGELHSRVLSRLKCWTASLLYDENGKIIETQDGKLAYERQPRRTPIYSILRESNPRRSIVLSPRLTPFTSPESTPENESQALPSITPLVSPPRPGLDGNTVPSRKPKKRKRGAVEEQKWPQIVLSVRLDEAELELSIWREWIRSLPEEAKDIKIEGMYKSFSTLLLIRMPVSVWNLLPDNEAYSFVGYVTSENLAVLQDLETQNASGKMAIEERESVKDKDSSSKGQVHQALETRPRASLGRTRDTSMLKSDDEEGFTSWSDFLVGASKSPYGGRVHTDSTHPAPPPVPFPFIPKESPNLPPDKRRRTIEKASPCVPCESLRVSCDGKRPCSHCLLYSTGKSICVDAKPPANWDKMTPKSSVLDGWFGPDY